MDISLAIKIEQNVDLDDRIYLGDGLFETIRVENAKPCYSYLHWKRLARSAPHLLIPFDLSFDEWSELLTNAIYKNGIQVGGVKVILSAGPAPRGLIKKGKHPYLLIKSFSTSKTSRHPLSLITGSWQRDALNPIYQLKSVNYLEAILAQREAALALADDVLFFNTNNHATETTTANVFIIKNQTIITPLLTSGVLDGVTRKRLLAICKKREIECVEKNIEKHEIYSADAMFVTNSIQGLRVVQSVDNNLLPIHHPLLRVLDKLLSNDKRTFYMDN